MNSLFVAVAYMPMSFLAVTAALAALACAAELVLLELEASLLLLLLCERLPTTPPTTAPTMTRTATGMPNLIQLLVPFFAAETGVMKPVDSL